MQPGTLTISPLTESDRARIAAGLNPTPLTDLDRLALRVLAPLAESISHEGGQWVVRSADGTKVLGRYGSEAAAKKRLAQVEMFKHMREADLFAQFLAEKGGKSGDHFFGAWKGGKAKSGGEPAGVKGIPHTDGIDNHPDKMPAKPSGVAVLAFNRAAPGDRVEALVAVGKKGRGQSVRGTIDSRTADSVTINADGTKVTVERASMRHFGVTRHGLMSDVARAFFGPKKGTEPRALGPLPGNPFDRHLVGATVATPRRLELAAREALTSFEQFLLTYLDIGEKGGDHFYGAWRGGKRSEGGGPVGEDTMALYSDGKGGWSAERVAAVHEPYIESTMAGIPKSGIQPPTVFMTGGGPATGKTTGLINNPKAGIPGKTKAAHIDPDSAKQAIPEYRAGIKAGDKTIASHVHEESSHMSKMAVARNLQAGHDVVYDSVGDSGIAKLTAKVQQMRDMGAGRVNASYATTSVETAIARSDARAIRTGRYVPHTYIRQAHADVTRTTLAAIDARLFDKLDVWDTTSRTPKLIATATKGAGLRVRDKAAWAAFVSKAEVN